MYRTILFVVLFSTLLVAQKNDFYKELDRITNMNYFDAASISIVVTDLDNDTVIFSKDAKKLMHPASNMKVITSAAALIFLGPDYLFKTMMLPDGAIRNGVFTGKVYILGGLDPDFTQKDYATFIEWFKEKGVSSINAEFIADTTNQDSLLWGNGWMWDDDPFFDFPYMTSLVCNDNGFTLYYEPGEIGMPVNYSLNYNSPQFSIINNSVTVAEDTSDLSFRRNLFSKTDNRFRIEGLHSIDEKPDSIKLSLKVPDINALELFAQELRNNGISVQASYSRGICKSGKTDTVLFTRKLADVLPNLNKESDNLSAEMLLRVMGKELDGNKPFAKSGIKSLDKLAELVGISPDNLRMVDGSGVSHYNLVTADFLSRIVTYLYQKRPDLYPVFFNSLPVSGVDGTLEKRMLSGAANKSIFAKTGTLSGVSTLSGYAKTTTGTNISFSIFIQNFVGKTSIARYYQDKICELICKYL